MGVRWNFASWMWVSLGCVLTIAATTAWAITTEGGGSPFPLDDSFIHLAMAKNLVNGHWGVTAEEVSNASSAPLYTGLTALLGLVGVPWLWVPILLNVLATILLLGAASKILRRRETPSRTVTLTMLGLAILLPLPYIAQFGMEHTLHSALALLFVAAAVEALNGESASALLALGPLMMGVRLESAFLIGIAIVCLAGSRRYRDAILLGLASSLPIIALGIWNLSLGEHFLPNSILLKATPGGDGSILKLPLVILQKAVLQAFAAPHFVAVLVVLVAVADAALKQTRDWRHPRVLWPLAAVLAIGGHLAFANVGWLYRYEVYLVALAIMGLAISAPRPKLWMLALFVIPLAARGWQCVAILPPAILHISAQQLQMARFVHQNFDGEAIAAHDIGAVAFLSNARILDFAGLASRDVLNRRLSGQFNTEDIRRMAKARGTRIAMVYDSWFQGDGDTRQFWIGPKLPAEWVKVGEWRMRDAAVVGDQAVSFYAVSADSLAALQGALKSFASQLPARVRYVPN